MKLYDYIQNYRYQHDINYNLYHEYILMFNIQNRFILFLLGCIPTRLFLVFLARYGDKTIRTILSGITFSIATGFLIIYFGGLRKTGVETGGDVIWWNDLRPVHAFIYYAFAISNYYGNRGAWKLLLLDTFVGLTSFFIFHYRNNDFKRLLS